MRIAVSGTHCCGKSTLIDEFLLTHTNYAHEPEPYTVLVEDYGEEFSSEPCVADFYRQLEFMVDRLRNYAAGALVILERSPVDYLAYILALKDLKREEADSGLLRIAHRLMLDSIQNLDLIVFLPLDDADDIEVSDSEDPRLRKAADSRLVKIFEDDEFDLVSSGLCTVVEARGSTTQRLRTVEDAIGSDPSVEKGPRR
jgi:predicted ATPase